MASSLISDMSKEIKKSEESSLDTIKKIDLKEVEEIISETSDLTEEGVDKLVTIIKSREHRQLPKHPSKQPA